MSIFSFDLELRLKGQMSSRAFAPSVIQVKLSSNMYTWNFHSVGPFHLHKSTFGNCNLKQSGDGAINQNRRVEPHNWSPRGQTMKDIMMHNIHSKHIEVKRIAIAPESHLHTTLQSIYTTNCRYTTLRDVKKKSHYALRPSNYYQPVINYLTLTSPLLFDSPLINTKVPTHLISTHTSLEESCCALTLCCDKTSLGFCFAVY
jgi:hypothetical protein